VRLVIFDFDGVLADTAEDMAHAANGVLLQYGMKPVPVLEVRRRIGGGAEALMSRLMVGASDWRVAEAAALFKRGLQACHDHTHLYPGVRATLGRLHSQGVRLAVATNKVEAITVDALGRLGISAEFDIVVGAESVTHRKPDPEAVRLILDRLRIRAREALMVGDTAADITAGKRAGTWTCAVLYGYGEASDLEAAEPDFQVARFDEIPDLLRTERPPAIGSQHAQRHSDL
jgi:2-phosphoglycolate phosphatase